MSRAGDKLVWLCRHVFCYNSGVNFPDWIVQEMNAREWSQSDLARQSGLTRQAISHLIAGRTKNPANGDGAFERLQLNSLFESAV